MSHDDWPGRGEPPVREWKHRGLTCRIYFNPMGTLNGYVELPADHPTRHLDLQWDDCEVFDVHGGITYGGDGRRVIGWDDCEVFDVHGGDNWEGDPAKPGRLWTVDDAEDETTRLADQVADLYTPESIAMFKASRTLRELADELDPTKDTHA